MLDLAISALLFQSLGAVAIVLGVALISVLPTRRETHYWTPNAA